jgi:DNA-binding NarL/FixJ family response regulator
MRILIADDHEIVRKGLKQILTEYYIDVLIEEVGDGELLTEKALEAEWDIVISDISMPRLNGLEALRRIKEVKPNLPMLMLSIHSEDQYALRVMKAGAHGYMTKDLAQQELVNAVEKVLAGKKFISPGLAEKLAETLKNESDEVTHATLSDREFDVFQVIGVW